MAAKFSGVAKIKPSAASTSSGPACEACSSRTSTLASAAAPARADSAIWRVPPVMEWYTINRDLDSLMPAA